MRDGREIRYEKALQNWTETLSDMVTDFEVRERIRVSVHLSAINKPVVAIVLSLVGGGFILIAGLFRTFFRLYGSLMAERLGRMAEFMESYMHLAQMAVDPWTIISAVIGTVSGLLVVIGATMVDYHPEAGKRWAIVILAFSVIGILGGSFSRLYVGSVLGVVGGTMAFFWRPETPTGG